MNQDPNSPVEKIVDAKNKVKFFLNPGNLTWDFTREWGVVMETRQLSETHVSGGGSDSSGNVRPVTSHTTHFNRCRIKWDDGRESFVDLSCTYSNGDKVSVVYANGVKVADINSTTHEYFTPRMIWPKEKWLLPALIVTPIVGICTATLLIGIVILIGYFVFLSKLKKESIHQYRVFLFGEEAA
jgi:hypothetical protein